MLLEFNVPVPVLETTGFLQLPPFSVVPPPPPELVFEPTLLLLCLKSCSMSCSCWAVRPLLENFILVLPPPWQSPLVPLKEDLEMRWSGPLKIVEIPCCAVVVCCVEAVILPSRQVVVVFNDLSEQVWTCPCCWLSTWLVVIFDSGLAWPWWFSLCLLKDRASQ